MNIILFIIYGYIGWKYGNWKDFSRYYPSLLFFIIGDLLYQFLLFDHTMWKFKPLGFIDEGLQLNHSLIALGKMAIQYPVTLSIFLGRLSSEKSKQILSIFLWTGIYGITECIAHTTGIMTYHHGWNYGWDLVFNVIMFSMLLLHYKKPYVAWLLVLPTIIGFWWIFDVPFSVLK
ncbi:CBO0543 family protein [Cytobacillus sp. FJAT-54145]|uniref:CBO0543 family protein n=1 Tax=Cytobacillus spartinae TaxID=3299023 RepID=A0ABW6K656_9BACI